MARTRPASTPEARVRARADGRGGRIITANAATNRDRAKDCKSFAVAHVGDEGVVAGHLGDIGAHDAAEELEEEPGTYAYVGRLYVCPRDRRRGLARSLMNALLGRLLREGVAAIYLEAAPEEENLSAEALIGFYRSVGFFEDTTEPYGHLLCANEGSIRRAREG